MCTCHPAFCRSEPHSQSRRNAGTQAQVSDLSGQHALPSSQALVISVHIERDYLAILPASVLKRIISFAAELPNQYRWMEEGVLRKNVLACHQSRKLGAFFDRLDTITSMMLVRFERNAKRLRTYEVV